MFREEIGSGVYQGCERLRTAEESLLFFTLLLPNLITAVLSAYLFSCGGSTDGVSHLDSFEILLIF